MHQDPVQEAIEVTIFLEVLNEDVARTELSRSHPGTFKGQLPKRYALNLTLSTLGYAYPYRLSHVNTLVASNRLEPMNLSLVEAGEETLQAAEPHNVIRRCFMCGTKHLRPASFLRNARKARKS